MFVIAVIGVLATVAIPNYSAYLARTKVVDALTLSQEVRQQIGEFYAHTGRFPANNAALALPDPLRNQKNVTLVVENGSIHLVLPAQWHQQEPARTLSLRPVLPSDEETLPMMLPWVCGYATVAAGWTVVGNNQTSFAENDPFLPRECGRTAGV